MRLDMRGVDAAAGLPLGPEIAAGFLNVRAARATVAGGMPVAVTIASTASVPVAIFSTTSGSQGQSTPFPALRHKKRRDETTYFLSVCYVRLFSLAATERERCLPAPMAPTNAMRIVGYGLLHRHDLATARWAKPRFPISRIFWGRGG
jgi:hypothetical protein